MLEERNSNHKRALGDCAEALVYDYLKSVKKTTMSSDIYDDEKDMIFNGFPVEVKARTRVGKYPYPNTFAIEKSQWQKIDNCPINIFVSVPMSINEYVEILFLRNKTSFKLGSFGKGLPIQRFYPIVQMQSIYTYKDIDTVQRFYDLNFSKYKV